MKIYTIGRDPSSDIVLQSSVCSRTHAIISISSNGIITLEDKSTNGTSITGIFIQNRSLQIQPNDIILFGAIEKLDWSKLGYNNNVEAPLIDSSISPLIEKTPETPTIIPNPVPPAPPSPPFTPPKKRWKLISAALLILSLLFFVAYKVFYHPAPRVLAPTEVYNKYKNAVALVEVEYYVKIHTSVNDIYMGLDEKGEIHLNKEKSELKPFSSQGTSFFINTTGMLITNRHVIQPWQNDESLKDYFNEKIKPFIVNVFRSSGFVHENPTYLGELDGIYIYPNGRTYQKYNRMVCKVNKISTKDAIDLASIQTEQFSLPSNATAIGVEDIEAGTELLEVNTNVYIVGFPLGNTLATDESNQLNCSSTQGSITQAASISYIQYSANTDHGASGSPVFNQYGKLIAINYEGYGSHNFNRGILSKYINELR